MSGSRQITYINWKKGQKVIYILKMLAPYYIWEWGGPFLLHFTFKYHKAENKVATKNAF